MIVGTRQLGLAILMHEAAHGGLHSNKAVNEWVGQWLCAVPVGADLAGELWPGQPRRPATVLVKVL